MKDNFYRAFEDRFRGTRKSIKERLKIYLPFVLPLKEHYSQKIALDIGCGRGEWLELLAENDIDAFGVDIDEGMLEACQILGLHTVQGDGITLLQKQANESVIIVSAFHVAEHISFDALQTLISEALRVLVPGGLLILETPNPENIRVSTESFYVDPSHVRPIPSSLLAFTTEYYGYIHNKIIGLQESKELCRKDFASLREVIENASYDYAVIAQKTAAPEFLALFDEAFSKEYGLSLDFLENKFEKRLLYFETGINDLSARMIGIEKYFSEAAGREEQAKLQLHSVLNSQSWKITKPLRFLTKNLHRLTAYIFR